MWVNGLKSTHSQPWYQCCEKGVLETFCIDVISQFILLNSCLLPTLHRVSVSPGLSGKPSCEVCFSSDVAIFCTPTSIIHTRSVELKSARIHLRRNQLSCNKEISEHFKAQFTKCYMHIQLCWQILVSISQLNESAMNLILGCMF